MEINIEEILKSISLNKSLVKYHNGWGFYIETPFEEIQMIGLNQKEDNLEIGLFFGDSQRQSRAFYLKEINIDKLANTKWKIVPNFHFSSTYKNLVWFESNLSAEEYLAYWRKNTNLLFQHDVKDIPELVKKLANEGVIITDQVKLNELESEIYDKEYSLINICAGFGLLHSISLNKAIELIEAKQFNNFLIQKINEGLSIINRNGNDLLINFSPINFEGDPDGL